MNYEKPEVKTWRLASLILTAYVTISCVLGITALE